jgi:hypothetical protein
MTFLEFILCWFIANELFLIVFIEVAAARGRA